VVVLGSPEHCRRRRGDVPFSIDAEQAEKANKSVTHQCNTSTLGSGAEESDFDLLFAKELGVFVKCVPRRLTDARAVVLQRVNDTNASASIDVNFVPEADEKTRVVTRGTEIEDGFANSRISLFIDGTERGRWGLLRLDVGNGDTQETALSGQGRCTRTRSSIRWGFASGSKREAEGIKFGSGTLSRGEALGRTYMEDQGDDIELTPETATEIWDELIEVFGDTGSHELHEVLIGEGSDASNDEV
jgi:hypothetical protein